ncbi:MAG: hypothetical protein Q8Q12_20935 [bacterium]|nr:hypothetical protein [bacterium]
MARRKPLHALRGREGREALEIAVLTLLVMVLIVSRLCRRDPRIETLVRVIAIAGSAITAASVIATIMFFSEAKACVSRFVWHGVWSRKSTYTNEDFQTFEGFYRALVRSLGLYQSQRTPIKRLRIALNSPIIGHASVFENDAWRAYVTTPYSPEHRWTAPSEFCSALSTLTLQDPSDKEKYQILLIDPEGDRLAREFLSRVAGWSERAKEDYLFRARAAVSEYRARFSVYRIADQLRASHVPVVMLIVELHDGRKEMFVAITDVRFMRSLGGSTFISPGFRTRSIGLIETYENFFDNYIHHLGERLP